MRDNQQITVVLTERQLDALYAAAISGLVKDDAEGLDQIAVREALQKLYWVIFDQERKR